jgi:hypothetical protein
MPTSTPLPMPTSAPLIRTTSIRTTSIRTTATD